MAMIYLLFTQNTFSGMLISRTNCDWDRIRRRSCCLHSECVSNWYARPANGGSMYFHCTLLIHFRPFLKLKITATSVSPRSICVEASENISALVQAYKSLYGLR